MDPKIRPIILEMLPPIAAGWGSKVEIDGYSTGCVVVHHNWWMSSGHLQSVRVSLGDGSKQVLEDGRGGCRR